MTEALDKYATQEIEGPFEDGDGDFCLYRRWRLVVELVELPGWVAYCWRAYPPHEMTASDFERIVAALGFNSTTPMTFLCPVIRVESSPYLSIESCIDAFEDKVASVFQANMASALGSMGT